MYQSEVGSYLDLAGHHSSCLRMLLQMGVRLTLPKDVRNAWDITEAQLIYKTPVPEGVYLTIVFQDDRMPGKMNTSRERDEYQGGWRVVASVRCSEVGDYVDEVVMSTQFVGSLHPCPQDAFDNFIKGAKKYFPFAVVTHLQEVSEEIARNMNPTKTSEPVVSTLGLGPGM